MTANRDPWHGLTRSPIKARLYKRDTYFREGLADAGEILGPALEPILRRSALLMVKPDGLAAGKAAEIVRFLATHGYAPRAVETPALGRFHWRELWRFQLTSATADRLAVNDLFLRGNALLLLLQGPEEGLPATVRLSGLKGPSDTAAQPPDCLRRRIGQPNRVFSYFHVADEPADLLRELAVLLDAPARRRVLALLGAGELPPADRHALDEALAASGRNARDLDGAAALGRAFAAVERVGAGLAAALPALDRVRRDLRTMDRGGRIAWRPFAGAVAKAGIVLDPWDLAALGAAFIVYDEPGFAKQILPPDPAEWRA